VREAAIPFLLTPVWSLCTHTPPPPLSLCVCGQVWRRREPWYDACAPYLFPIRAGDSDTNALAADAARLVRVWAHAPQGDGLGDGWVPLAGVRAAPLRPRFFVCLTYTNVAAHATAATLRAVSEGADAIELRVDLWDDHSPAAVAEQVPALPPVLARSSSITHTDACACDVSLRLCMYVCVCLCAYGNHFVCVSVCVCAPMHLSLCT
jgi:hypothetical protein